MRVPIGVSGEGFGLGLRWVVGGVIFQCKMSCEPSRELQEFSGPPGPKSPKSLKKVSRGLRPRGPEKSGKSLEKVPNRHFRDFFQTFQTSSRLFPDFLGPRGQRPRGLFSDFWGIWGISGPEGPRDSCSSWEGSQKMRENGTGLGRDPEGWGGGGDWRGNRQVNARAFV